MIAPPGLKPLPHPREGRYGRADTQRQHAERQHRAALAARDGEITRCPACGAWVAHPQPGEPAYRSAPGRRRPRRHDCPVTRRPS